MRRYYLHRRRGIYYVEFVVPETGLRLTARSTGARDRDEAVFKAAEWLKTGIPTGRDRQCKPLEIVVGIETILKSIKKASLSQDDAVRIVAALRDKELIDTPVVKHNADNLGLIEFLNKFWDYETSPYVKEKEAYRHIITKGYCIISMNRVRKHWTKFFGGKLLREVARDDLKRFSIFLSGGGLSPNTINAILKAGTIAIRWAFREGKIPSDPTAGIQFFSGDIKARGVLTPAEAAAVFSVKWENEMAYVGNLIACSTGLRAGEILALRLENIEERTINVLHSWGEFDHLKSTKNKEARKAPLFPEVREKILELAEKNPYGKDGFIFFGKTEDAPAGRTMLRNGLLNACGAVGANPPGWVLDPKDAGGGGFLWEARAEKDKFGRLLCKWSEPVKIDEEAARQEENPDSGGGRIEKRYRRSLGKPEDPMYIDCKARNIVFHSHRHYYASRMTDRMTAEQVRRITGHKSEAVFRGYSDHLISENLEQAEMVGAEVFGGILAASKGA
jgi:integrase